MLFTSRTLTSGELPELIDVDITGVQQLKCEVKMNGDRDAKCGFYDAELIP